MASPFHYSFFVTDLEGTRPFQGEILGRHEGHCTEAWVDFDFFGNQISVHTTGTPATTEDKGAVDGIALRMPHFGADLRFVIEPRLRVECLPAEQVTMCLLDPRGSALEFKASRRPGGILGGTLRDVPRQARDRFTTGRTVATTDVL